MSTQRLDIERPAGYRSQEVALVIAQMDDQLRLLREGLKGITADELQWQPKPGMNTIAMLLAHLAIVEVWWTMLVLAGEDATDLLPALGIGADDDGMPLPEGGAPPAVLAGRDLSYFDDLLTRARRYLKEKATGVADEGLTREITRTRSDGSQRTVTVRWFFYHIAEHFSGHFGQILMLRHLYRASRVPMMK
ncbi:MAG TPA: DinB family protein [Candidatus Eisenbacteria bacterium]|jgi:uncharacterized damage-inducible protein DinB